MPSMHKAIFNIQHPVNYTRWHKITIPAFRKGRQEDQKFEVIFIYIADSRPA